MTTMDTGNVDKAKQLFRSLPIGQIKEINHSLEVQANEKTNQLRSLVGTKYRSLLSTADNIILMNSIVQEQDKKLAYLCDLNETQARVQDKLINNYHSFVTLTTSCETLDVQILARVLLSNLQTNLEQLISHIERPSKAELNSVIDNRLIQTAKEFRLFDGLLRSFNIKDNTLYFRFCGLKSRYEKYLRSLILKTNSYKTNYISNNSLVIILVSVMFLLDLNLPDVLKYYIDIKSRVLFKLLDSPHFIQLESLTNLSKTLECLYVSLNYLKIFFSNGTVSKTFLNQIIRHISFNNHQFKANLKEKYSLILDKFDDFDSFLAAYQLNTSINDFRSQFENTQVLESIIAEWKIKLANLFAKGFESRLNSFVCNCNEFSHQPFTRLLELMRLTLTEFKKLHLSTLSTIYLADGQDLLKCLISIWQTSISQILKNQIAQISTISNSINHLNLNIQYNEEFWSLSQNDIRITDIENYLRKISSFSAVNLSMTGTSSGKNTLPDILLLLIYYFNNLKVILIVFIEQFLKELISSGTSSLFIKEDVLDDYFRDDNDLDIYGNSDQIENFVNIYNKLFSTIYNELRSKYFDQLLFNTLKVFLSSLDHKAPTTYNLNSSILRILCVFRKLIKNKSLRQLLLNDNAIKSSGFITLEEETNKVIELHYGYIIGAFSTEVYSSFVKAILQRFCTIEGNFDLRNFISGLDNLKGTSDKHIDSQLLVSQLLVNPNVIPPIEEEVWENGLPVVPSTKVSLLLFNLCQSLISGDNAKGQTNLDLFKHPAFKNHKNRFILNMLRYMKESLQAVEKVYCKNNDVGLQKTAEDDIVNKNLLLCLADMHYLLIFISTSEDVDDVVASIKASLQKIANLSYKEGSKELFSQIDERFVSKNIEDSFKQNKLLYLPLSVGIK